MGRLSNMRFQGRGPRPRSNGSKTGPLRKVIGNSEVGGAWMEALECGHLQMPKRDLMGETNAVRRRCLYCKSGRAPHFTGEPPTYISAEEWIRRTGAKAEEQG